MTKKLTRFVLLLAAAIPLVAVSTSRLWAAKPIGADCTCNTFCIAGSGNCTWLICSGGGAWWCYGVPRNP